MDYFEKLGRMRTSKSNQPDSPIRDFLKIKAIEDLGLDRIRSGLRRSTGWLQNHFEHGTIAFKVFNLGFGLMTQRLACLILLCGSVLMVGCFSKSKPASPNGGAAEKNAADPTSPASNQPLTERQKQIKSVNDSENVLQSLASQMSQLSLSFRERSVALDEIAKPKIEYLGLAEFDWKKMLADSLTQPGLAVHFQWPVESAAKPNPVESTKIWDRLLTEQTFDSCQFGTLGCRLNGSQFEMDTKFEGRFRTTDNQIVGVKAYQTLQWDEISPDSWRIAKWTQTKFEFIASPDALFEDVTAKVIPDPATLEKAQSSSHRDLILANTSVSGRELQHTREKYKAFNDWESAYQYPAISTVDLDQDGFDDLYITDRWQSGQLLRNRGDGTFEDVTESSGLTVDELACCSFFVDFDNDGDSDAFIGGTLETSKYFENIDGVFHFDKELNEKEYDYMRFVVSGSVVDVNGDGLLDLYLNTYGFGTGDESIWSEDYIRIEDRLKMRLKVEGPHWYVDRGGAPNILLLNHGGTLKRAKIGDELAQWRNSYQTVWSDYDQDGDPDLYICNDFSPDHFMRNDTERGSFDAKFTDVSAEMVPGGTMGFGMGASWGDYNNDGLLDLYVSNMYSKAGNRIVPQFDDVDERLKISAQGNFLYENIGGKFKQVAGGDDADQHVSKVGWSFGGQFADFDNDGHLDLYVPSGFFTPPPEVQKPGDW